MTIKCTMFFEQNVGDTPYGWTESIYDSTSGNLPSALLALQLVAKRRAKLVGWGVSMPLLRVSDPLVFRDSQISAGITDSFTIQTQTTSGQVMMTRVPEGEGNTSTINDTWQSPTATPAPLGLYLASNPNLAVLVRMEGGITYQSRRAMLLRGNPHGIFAPNATGPEQYNGQAARVWVRKLGQYVDALIAGSYGFYGIDQSNANPLREIAALTISPAGNFTANMPNATPNVGQKVRIQGGSIMGSKGPVSKLVNKVWTVSSLAGTVVTFIGSNNFAPDNYTTLNNGKFRLQQGTVILFNKYIDIRYSNRKTGRPFFLPRGRARARRSA